MAARYHNNIAEICESELADFEQVNVCVIPLEGVGVCCASQLFQILQQAKNIKHSLTWPDGKFAPLSPSHTPYTQAITHYEQAADYYKGEDSTG